VTTVLLITSTTRFARRMKNLNKDLSRLKKRRSPSSKRSSVDCAKMTTLKTEDMRSLNKNAVTWSTSTTSNVVKLRTLNARSKNATDASPLDAAMAPAQTGPQNARS
jgi:hypothetical protein